MKFFFSLRCFVLSIYADHNTSLRVNSALRKCLAELGTYGKALNIGAGTKRLHPKMFNLDIVAGEMIDVVGSAEALPFEDP